MSARLKRQVIRALPWSFVESVINGLAGLALTFIFAWFLQPKELGQAGIVLSVVGVAQIIAELGMIEALVQARSVDTHKSDTAFTAVVIAGLVAAGICWMLAGPVASLYQDPLLAELLQVGALILPVNALVVIPTALLTRKLRAGALSLRMITSRVTTIVGIGVLAYLGYGAWAPVVGTLVGLVAAALVLALTMSRWPRVRFSMSEFRGLLAFGSVLSVHRLLQSSMIRVFWLVIGYVHGPVVLGYFQFAQRLIDETANLVRTFALRFGLSFFAALERAEKDLTGAFLKATRLVTAVAVPTFVGLALVMPDLIGTVIDSRWAPAVIVAQIAALGWVITFPRVLVEPVLRARGHQGVLVAYVAACFVITVGTASLTGGYSVTVVALVWLLRQIIGVPWSAFALHHYLEISPKRLLATVARPLVAAVLMAAVVFGMAILLQDWTAGKRLVVLVATGAAAYAVAMALIDGVTLRLARTILTDIWRARRAA